MPHSFNLGSNKPLIDSRNITLGKVQAAPSTLPSVFMNKFAWDMTPETIDLYYQRNTPSCGAHSAALLKYILDSKDETSSHKPYSARFTWNRIRARDGLDPSMGSWFKTIMDSLRKDGACDIDLLPNDTTLTDLEYVTPKLTQEMFTNALPKQVGGCTIDTAPSWEKIQQAISQNGAVILLVSVSERWWKDKDGNITWDESKIMPLHTHKHNETISRHYFVAHSYDENYIYGLNSFSSKYAKGGHIYFGKDYLIHVDQMLTAQDIKDEIVRNIIAQQTLLTKVVSLYQQLVALKLKKYV